LNNPRNDATQEMILTHWLASSLVALASSTASSQHAEVSPWAADNTLLRSHLLGDAGMNMPLGENQAYTYDPAAPPDIQQMTYSVDLQLMGLQVEEARDTAIITGRLAVRWEDGRLQWNTTEYPDGALELWTGFQAADIFTPDIRVLHDAEGPGVVAPAVVHPSGTVTWNTVTPLRASCVFDRASFPFDEPKCTIMLGSYSRSAQFARLKKSAPAGTGPSSGDAVGPPIQGLPSDGAFSIATISVAAATVLPPGGMSSQAGPWDAIAVSVTLKRAPRYYWLCFMAPSMVLCLLSFAVFWQTGRVHASHLSPWSDSASFQDGTERLSYGGLIVVAILGLQVAAMQSIPPTSQNTLLHSVMALCLTLALAALVESGLVLMLLHKKDEHLTPLWFQRGYAKCLLKLGVNTMAGETSDIGTVESNKALQLHLATRGSQSNNPRAGKRVAQVPTLENVMLRGTNLAMAPCAPLKSPTNANMPGSPVNTGAKYGLFYMEAGARAG